MASKIFFAGQITAVPGAYSEVDAAGLAVVGLNATGIVGVIGEAEGGSPYNGDTPIYRISNPAKVGKTFLSGDLREAGNILFGPSNDPEIPGGMQEGHFVKVNPATRSSRVFQRSGVDVLRLTSLNYGSRTTQINADIADGTNQGKAITLILNDVSEIFDDVGGDAAFTVGYTPGSHGAATMTLQVDNAVGVTGLFTKTGTGLDGDYIGALNGLTGLDTDKDATVGAGNVVNIRSSSASDVGGQVVIYGLNGSNNPASETLTLNGTSAVVGAATWNAVSGVIKLTATVGNITVKDNTTTTTLYVLDTPASLTAGGGVNDFAGTLVESVDSTVAVVADGASTNIAILVGLNASATPTLEKITLNGTTPVTSATVWSRLDAVVMGYIAAARSLTISGQQFNYGDVACIKSSSASDASGKTVTLYGLDNTGAVQSEVLTLNGTSLVTGVATWRRIYGAILNVATVGTITVSAMETVTGVGNLTLFTWNGASVLSQGLTLVDNVHVGGTAVTVVADTTTTRPLLLIGLSATGAAQIEALTLTSGTPVVGTLLWSEITAIGMAHVENARTVTASGRAFRYALADYATIKSVTDQIAALSGWAVTVGTNAGDILVEDMDNKGPTSVLSTTVDFGADLGFIIAKINEESQLVSAEVIAGATGAPDNTAAPVYLQGGVEGATSFNDWQAALDLLRGDFVNTIVVLTDDDAVQAAVKAHCVYMCGPGRKERDCVLGAPSQISFTAVKTLAQSLNTRHARLAVDDIDRINTSGETETFPPIFTACLAAGMQAGAQVGTSLTHKFANVLAIAHDSSYTIEDDANEIIDNGVLVMEEVQGRGFRWLRNVTTYLIDDNLAYTEASVNQAVNVTVYTLRTNLEDKVVGGRGSGTLNAALGEAVTTLNKLCDPNGGSQTITNWRSLAITLAGDVMDVDVEIAPEVPTNFVRLTLHLVASTQSVAA